MERVTLREITAASVRDICKLDAGDGGKQVSPNSVSIAQAHFEPAAWFRAIYAADVPVGFIMLYDPSQSPAPEEPDFFLWRLMVDKAQQGNGYGAAAVELLVEHVRTRPGAKELLVSHVKGQDDLARFYQARGFVYRGDEHEGELIMLRKL
jgi:diamine N-acetyltransferase